MRYLDFELWVIFKMKWKVRFRLEKIPHKQRTIRFEKARQKSVTFTDTEIKNCFSIYHIETKSLIYFCQFTKNDRELNSRHANLSRRLLGGEKYLLITSKLANQRVQRVLFKCAVYTDDDNDQKKWKIVSHHKFHRLILLLRLLFLSYNTWLWIWNNRKSNSPYNCSWLHTNRARAVLRNVGLRS